MAGYDPMQDFHDGWTRATLKDHALEREDQSLGYPAAVRMKAIQSLRLIYESSQLRYRGFVCSEHPHMAT